ncbi:hypothetical protein PM082_019102 [Marasmius tenuissimus]|nr:hypothetical protein PM082_019102 [Marasmius tenuissimus]
MKHCNSGQKHQFESLRWKAETDRRKHYEQKFRFEQNKKNRWNGHDSGVPFTCVGHGGNESAPINLVLYKKFLNKLMHEWRKGTGGSGRHRNGGEKGRGRLVTERHSREVQGGLCCRTRTT